MEPRITLNDVNRAWISRDPALPDLIIRMSEQGDPRPEKPFKGHGAWDYSSFVQRSLRDIPWDEDDEKRMRARTEAWRVMEAPDAEHPLPDRFRLYVVLLELWKENGLYERDCIFRVIDRVRFRWGVWRAVKRIFKEAETRDDTEMLGALNARLDGGRYGGIDGREVRSWTVMYLRRRAWRYLRQRAAALPAAYVDTAVDFLRFYSDEFSPNPQWTQQHILCHESGDYTHASFWMRPSAKNFLEYRPYGELWERSPRPLFTLLERARSENIRECAVAALKTDFPVALRESRPDWVARLITIRSQKIDEFVVWLLSNVPRFAQDKFKELELHEPVLRLLDSGSKEARKYAAEYARVYARDLELERLLVLINHDEKEVRALARDLLESRDPRTDVGLEAWGSLLGSSHADEYAREMILKNFNAAELTPTWFRERLLEPDSFSFASEKLLEIHSRESLSAGYFSEMLDDGRLSKGVAKFAWKQILHYAPLDQDVLRRFYLLKWTHRDFAAAADEGKIEPRDLGADFLKAVAYRPLWDANEFIGNLIDGERRLRPHGETVPEFGERRALEWLGDFRRFNSDELGADWLLELARRTEAAYHEWAADYMVRGMAPEAFAREGKSGPEFLWDLLNGPGKDDEPGRLFAARYLRERDLDMAPGGGPAGHEGRVESSFVDYEKGRTLILNERANLRALGLDYARRRMAAWQPDVDQVLELCESNFMAVRDFTAKALLADDEPKNRAFRIDAEAWSADDVYRFCESLRDFTRNLGMQIISRAPKFAKPDELFRLTESPDRRIRFFVIQTIWDLYRGRGITLSWTPPPDLQTDEGKTDSKKKEENQEAAEQKSDVAAETGADMPDMSAGGRSIAERRGEGEIAGRENLRNFLRRVLFEIPPARYSGGSGKRVRVLPARKAKLYMIEVLRELSVEHVEFARLTVPLLTEFMHSRGKSEHAACLVALTRIHETHPRLEASA